jgi:hypothetical protein
MQTDSLIPIVDTARINGVLNLPTPPHCVTLHRWCTRGVGGHRLNKVRVGGRTYIAANDLRAFITAINSGTTGHKLVQP